MAAVLLSGVNASAHKYYWYAGQIKPISMSVDPTPSEEYLCNNWFELGDNMPDIISKLLKGGANDGGAWYMAVPCAEGQSFYPTASDLSTPDHSVVWTNETITVNGVTYNIFEYSDGTRISAYFRKFDETLFIVFPPRYIIRYGDEIPELSENCYSVYNTLGRTLSKPLKWSTEATNNSPCDLYEIVADMESVEENILFWGFSFINIRIAPLTVGVKDVTIIEGEEIPTFTLTYDGFKNNETDAVLITKPTATTTATSSSKAGIYSITVSGGEAQNYDFIYADGKLIITEKESVTTPLKGDVNYDGTVDVADIASVIDVMAQGGNDASADVNKDGNVDVADIATIIDKMAEK